MTPAGRALLSTKRQHPSDVSPQVHSIMYFLVSDIFSEGVTQEKAEAVFPRRSLTVDEEDTTEVLVLSSSHFSGFGRLTQWNLEAVIDGFDLSGAPNILRIHLQITSRFVTAQSFRAACPQDLFPIAYRTCTVGHGDSPWGWTLSSFPFR